MLSEPTWTGRHLNWVVCENTEIQQFTKWQQAWGAAALHSDAIFSLVQTTTKVHHCRGSVTSWLYHKMWMTHSIPVSLCPPPGMIPIPQDKRVSMGLNGDLYFSNVLAKDTLNDYSCNARFLFTHTIQQKNPFVLKVVTSESTSRILQTLHYTHLPQLLISFYGNIFDVDQWMTL